MKNKLNTIDVITLYYQIARNIVVNRSHYYNANLTDENMPLTKESADLIRQMYIGFSGNDTITTKVRFVIELFLSTETHYTIEEISAFTRLAHELDPFVPAISSSSVQRYCTAYTSSDIIPKAKIAKVQEILEENAKIGRSKGGTISTLENIATKDENGKFTGSVKGTKSADFTPDYIELVEGQAKQFLNGDSLDTIAATTSVMLGHEVTKLEVRRALNVDLKKVNKNLYDKIQEFKKTQKKLEQITARDELIEMYHLYIDEGYSYSQIAASFDINISNVSRALNQRLRQMAKIFPDDITPEMLQKVDEKKLANEVESHTRRRR